jgi:lipopolysaccharide export system protein LptA
MKYLLSLLILFLSTSVFSQEEKGKGIKQALAGGGGGSKDPVFIQSDTLNLDSKGRIFTYRGNVHVLRGDLEITSDVLVGKYSENQELENILCRGNVVVTRGEGMRATSNRAFYNVQSSKIELTEEPELNRGGNVLAADKIIVFVNEDRSEAEGNVRVKVLKAEEGEGSSSKIKNKLKQQKES